MKCEKMKDIIITDYIDGFCTQSEAAEIESHLKECEDCRRFLEAVRNRAILPFGEAGDQKAPDTLWNAVRDRIEERKSESQVISIKSFLKHYVFSKPVLSVVSIAAMFALVIFAGNMNFGQKTDRSRQQAAEEYLFEAMDYSLENNAGYSSGFDVFLI